jgi:hypothetical protein
MKTSITTAGKLPVISVTQSLKQIRKLHGEIFQAVRTSLPKAVKIGELLTGIKDKMDHGEWLPWIQKNLPFSERTAQNYIRCFDEKDRLKSATVADLPLSVSGALALLSEPKIPAPLDSGRAARAAELDAQIIQSIADIKIAAADFGDGELPPGFIGFNDMKEFFASKGKSLDIELTDADEAGFRVLEFYLANGAVVSRETVLECLRQFNPARQFSKAA